jgi:hypothetical protein
MTLWLIAPRGCNKESCMTFELRIDDFGKLICEKLSIAFFRPSVNMRDFNAMEQRDCHLTDFLKI